MEIPPKEMPTTAARGRRRRRQPENRKSNGRLTSNPNIDKQYPLSLTKMCHIPKLHDISDPNTIAIAGDLIIVNCAPTTLPEIFKVDGTFKVFEGGELAALVHDWTDDLKEVSARRQISSDSSRECTGAVEIFQLSHVCTLENHVIGETLCHSFTGFATTSVEWNVPFLTSWMASRRKDADHQNYTWDSSKDPGMKALKNVFLETLPCSLARFDIIQAKVSTMHELAFITESEVAVLNTYSQEALRNFELLVLQFLPECGAPNWKKINVIFISNWRVVVAKTCDNDFKDYLLANTCYLDRFDFEDTLFQLSATVGIFEDISELKSASTLHDILVSIPSTFQFHNALALVDRGSRRPSPR